MSDIKYWLALLFAPGLGVIKINKLIEHYGSPKNVIENHLPMITASGFLTSATIDYLKHPDWNLIEKNIRWSEAANHHIIPVKSPHYPQQLKEIPDPPPVLFINGNVNLLAQNQIAIIGSRNPSYYGIETAKKFATALASYQLIITVPVIRQHWISSKKPSPCWAAAWIVFIHADINNSLNIFQIMVHSFPNFRSLHRHCPQTFHDETASSAD